MTNRLSALLRSPRSLGPGVSEPLHENSRRYATAEPAPETCMVFAFPARRRRGKTGSRVSNQMSDTLESLRRKIAGAGELQSVVRTMKALAAANIECTQTRGAKGNEVNRCRPFVRNIFKPVALALCLNLILTARIFAGPPFLTDDPAPVDLYHWEAYLFTSGMTSSDGYDFEGPAVELNYGVLPETQLHLIVPITSVDGPGMSAASGLGDMELGIKYRFVQETNERPQIGIFPMAELPTGNESRGLGNGRTWFRLPLWVQKSWGPWTTYGGGGAVVNSAPGQRNYPFGGWLVQRNFGKHLVLGGEVFAQGQDTESDKGFGALNFGGFYNVTEHFSLLFSAGHTVAGDSHALWYFGLYETW